MAHGKNAESNGHVGKDYWSKRPFSGWPVSKNGNKLLKRMTHKIERLYSKKEVSKELNNL